MKKLSVLLVAVLLLFGCSTTPTLTKYNDQMFDVGFDTVVQLLAYCEDEETYKKYQDIARSEFIRYNALFDKYNTYEGIQNVKTINDQAGIAPVKVDQEILDLLKKTKEYADLSDQQYNVTFGAVLELWHDARENAKAGVYKIPTAQELSDALPHTGWDLIEINEEDQTVYIKDKQASLDLGSAAKGYATEKVAQKLETEGLKNAIINAGGNVRIIGDKPDADHWSVGLQIPVATESSALADVYINSDMSFVTSGDYQRYFDVDGTRYHHIIDPHTLYPANYARSLTIVTKDSGLADILSTTLFTLTYEEGNALLENLRKQGMEIDAIWVFDDTTEMPDHVEFISSGSYKIAISDGIKDFVHVK